MHVRSYTLVLVAIIGANLTAVGQRSYPLEADSSSLRTAIPVEEVSAPIAKDQRASILGISSHSRSDIEPEVSQGVRDAESNRRFSNYIKMLSQDQKALWSSPLRMRQPQLGYLLGFIAATATLTQLDKRIDTDVRSSHASAVSHASDLGVAVLAGTAITSYVSGKVTRNDHLQETGMLASESGLDALLVTSIMQRSFGRARPYSASAGDFFHGGDSFPSAHSAIAWSVASVFAHEYPGWGTKALSYGIASGVSAARVAGGKHFASDAFVGSTLGWFIGRELYRGRNRQKETSWGTFQRSDAYENAATLSHKGSSYVPVDSWVYEAFDRLSNLGVAQVSLQNMRPWTRTECARLLQQISQNAGPESESLYNDLLNEFQVELESESARNLNASVESLYVRSTGIAGTTLDDGLHFGQSIVNDYGRPYRSGFNQIAGVSARAEAGPLAFYVRGEYQHSPSAAAPSDNVHAAIAASDGLPQQASAPIAQIDRFRLLESYVALNLGGWQASFGKQSLWWGPNIGGDLMLSNNAEPITMLRFTNVSPVRLPGVLSQLGEIRSDSFLGQLDGYHFLRLGPTFALVGSYSHNIDPQPYIWGQKLGLQLTPNLQLGVSITTVFAGLGRPLTWKTFLHTFSSRGDAQPLEPGDRRTGFDFSYRIPGLRKWLILYNSSISEDEPNPIAYPRRSAMNPGIFVPIIPKLHKLDFRAEAGYTNLPNDPRRAVFYTNTHYAGGYTNFGHLMGSWLGPQSRAYQLWSNYWFTGRTRLQLGFRKQQVDPAYIGGGSLRDVSCRYDFLLRPNLIVNSWVQVERWNFPVLSTRAQNNLSASWQLTYRPNLSMRSRRANIEQ